MHKIFVKDASYQIKLNEEQGHHINHVLRMKPQEQILVCDTVNSEEYIYQIVANDIIEMVSKQENNNELSNQISAVVPLLKNDRHEWVIQKLVELGVSEIYLYPAVNAVVRYNETKVSKKLPRFEKVVESAAKQSKRSTIPKISYLPLAQIDFSKYDTKIVAYEMTQDKQINFDDSSSSVCFCVGPEGGFDKKEIDYLIEKDFEVVGLGKRILRSETASIAIASHIMLKIEGTF